MDDKFNVIQSSMSVTKIENDRKGSLVNIGMSESWLEINRCAWYR